MYAIRSYYVLRHAGHANACAKKLSMELSGIPGVSLMHPVEANAVFVKMPQEVIDTLHAKGWVFYTFIGSGNCRFMCSWATSDEDIAALVNDVRDIMQ